VAKEEEGAGQKITTPKCPEPFCENVEWGIKKVSEATERWGPEAETSQYGQGGTENFFGRDKCRESRKTASKKKKKRGDERREMERRENDTVSGKIFSLGIPGERRLAGEGNQRGTVPEKLDLKQRTGQIP